MAHIDTAVNLEGPDLSLLKADDLKLNRPKRITPFIWGGIAALLTVIVALSLVLWVIAERRETFQTDLDRRLRVLVESRVDILNSWFSDQVTILEPVATSDVFRLFLTEVTAPYRDPDGTSSSAAQEMLAQSAYLQRILEDFIFGRQLDVGHLVGVDDRLYLTTSRTDHLFDYQLSAVTRAIADQRVAYTNVRTTLAGMVIDVAVPIFPPQPLDGSGTIEPVGALLVTLPIQGRVASILEPNPLARPGEQIRLLERTIDGWSRIDPAVNPPIAAATLAEDLATEMQVNTLRTSSPVGDNEVYGALAAVSGPQWFLLQEADAELAEKEVREFEIGITAAVAGGLLLILGIFGTFWFRLSSDHNRSLAEQFKELAAKIDQQRSFLGSITDTMQELLALKNAEGRYVFVNPAFCRAVGKEPGEILGQKDEAVFGFGTAQRLHQSDEAVLTEKQKTTTNEQIYLQSRLHHFQISKVPFADAVDGSLGILAVSRDITELVEAVERRERAIRGAVEAFSRAIELRDPYLVGHSRRVAHFAVAIGRRLDVSEADLQTLELAARLAQIGKLAIPEEILRKEGRLTPEEISMVQGHVEYAVSILRKVDFDLPVVESVQGMNERLDGTGYPRNLKGDEIDVLSRILGACDVFCARIEPRSYRETLTPDQAIAILEQNNTKYDSLVVATLSDVMHSPEGEKYLAA